MHQSIIKSPERGHQAVHLGKPVESAQQLASDPVGDDVTLKAEREALEKQVRLTVQREYAEQLEICEKEAFEKGFREGLTEGHKEGLATGAAAFDKQLALLDQLVSHAEAATDAWLNSVEKLSTEVAFDALGKLLIQQAVAPTLLTSLIQQITKVLHVSDVLSIKLHPADNKLLKAALLEAGMTSKLMRLIEEDPSILNGGVVVSTPRGEYQATLDVLLRRLQQLLHEQRQVHQHTDAPDQGENDVKYA